MKGNMVDTIMSACVCENHVNVVEGKLMAMHLVAYSNECGLIELPNHLDSSLLISAFEEFYNYESDEYGSEDTDYFNEGQSIIEVNRASDFKRIFTDIRPEKKRFF
ncbi:hypothetical protein [Paenibacillus thiaminolyticus]|uniref:Uncharacterized protein n=1 Tax=Paenibacillus thiaminolyticus TaxID=49283 RepID=A0A3A3GHK8_PANTH|nr:hypothetical protein [Paenibacillus thiaminolyticus]RJG21369.1 hypothetical protein DQX05_21975 [Paenibacillus thiaminolyticus]